MYVLYDLTNGAKLTTKSVEMIVEIQLILNFCHLSLNFPITPRGEEIDGIGVSASSVLSFAMQLHIS